MSRSVFRCISGCAGDHPLDQVIYKCPKCGDLLEVVHDIEALKTRSAASWIKLFDERYLRTTWPYGSGVWGKKEWVQPHVENENVVSMMEGGTNSIPPNRAVAFCLASVLNSPLSMHAARVPLHEVYGAAPFKLPQPPAMSAE